MNFSEIPRSPNGEQCPQRWPPARLLWRLWKRMVNTKFTPTHFWSTVESHIVGQCFSPAPWTAQVCQNWIYISTAHATAPCMSSCPVSVQSVQQYVTCSTVKKSKYTYNHLYWKWDTYVEVGQSISLSFLNWNGWNLVSRHIFSRCLDMQNFSSLSLVLSKLWKF